MNDNYMKTILSGVKEWTENLTDDAIDKANNALEQANKSIDKALFVVNITQNSDGTLSADKTFEEIVQVYNERKYNIVAKFMGVYIMPLLSIIRDHAAMFGTTLIKSRDIVSVIIAIAPDNSIEMIPTPLATTNSKLPNPYPLTFTGAVNETYDGSSAKTITIPSGGAHSDWNQNDSTAADYIKNRPFYTGDPVEMVLVEESSVSFALSGGFYSASFPTSFNAELGQTYKISWDGTVYECTCKDLRNLPIIGNQSILGIGSDTGEPFVIFNESGLNETGWASLTTDTSASHTISISGIGVPVTKIDEKYLPELPYMDKVNPTGTGSFSLNRKANTTVGEYSFAEGRLTTASGDSSHAEGDSTTASGDSSHAEGDSTTASGNFSHAEGSDTTASGNFSHAEGFHATASGLISHAEGSYTTASGDSSHAEGDSTTASGDYSHAEGYGTKASSKFQHVHGKYNIEDTSNTYAEIVGNGEQLENSNAHTLDWSGNAWYAGTVEGKALILPSSTAGSTKKFKITVDDSGTIAATEVV